ncbi:GNAT family N-acetyltransferase [Pseudonocardia sp. GCM10023141]|uniref:GNAT family N-acetyltransferase n=1 Tax=Pseudonocardia sp. GCM10023141 TaxID=3252653 RepID=UPI00361629E1
MIVRPRQPDDLTACRAVLHGVHLADAYPMRWPADPAGWLLRDGLDTAWVGELAGVIAGHIALRPITDTTAEIVRLFVGPSARGSGLGRALLDAAAAHAAGTGLRAVLDVVDGTGAVAFYEAAGWEFTTIEPALWTAPDGHHPLLRRYAAPVADRPRARW